MSGLLASGRGKKLARTSLFAGAMSSTKKQSMTGWAGAQTLFDDAARYDDEHREAQTTETGRFFATGLVEKLSSTNVAPWTVVLTAVEPAENGIILDGDFYDGQPAVAFWCWTESPEAYPKASSPVELRLIGVTASPESYVAMSEETKATIRRIEASRVIRIRCPRSFIAVREHAPTPYLDMIRAMEAAQDDMEGRISLMIAETPESEADEDPPGGDRHGAADDEEEPLRKRQRPLGRGKTRGEYVIDEDEEVEEQGDEGSHTNNASAKASSGLKFITDNDNIRCGVLSTANASERILDISVGKRMMDPERYSAFGVGQHLTATPALFLAKIEMHGERSQASKGAAAPSGSSWESAKMLPLMKSADVFKDPGVFAKVMTGVFDKHRIDECSILSFLYIDREGAESVEISLDKDVSTIILRNKVAMSFKGFENFLIIAMSAEYKGVADDIFTFLQCIEGDPCRGIPDAYFVYKCNECIVDVFQTLRTEQRASPNTLSGPRKCRAFLVTRFEDLVCELQAVASEGAHGHTIREFYQTVLEKVTFPAGERTPKPPTKKKNQPAGRSGGASTKGATQVKKSGIAADASGSTSTDEEAGARKSKQPPATAVVDRRKDNTVCMNDMLFLLNPAANKQQECDNASCKYNHVQIGNMTKAAVIKKVQASDLNHRQQTRLLAAIQKAPAQSFKN